MMVADALTNNESLNSLAPGRPGCHFKIAIFTLVLLIGIFTSSIDNALRWMPWDLTDDKSTLVQVMAWCRQATSHNLSQCWPSSMSPYGVTRPQLIIHCTTCLSRLTHLPLDKMAAISQTTISNVFPSLIVLLFWFEFQSNLFPVAQSTLSQH